MIRKSLVLSLILSLLTLCLAAGNAAAEETIVNGIDANFPPFAYIDKTGTPAGFDVEVMQIIGKEMGVKVVNKPIDWAGIIQSLVHGKIDMIASGMSITPKRQEVVDFTTPYWVITQVLVAKKDSTITVDEAMKGGKIIGVQQGTTEGTWLKDHTGKDGYNYTLRFYGSSALAVEDVINGRIAAAVMDDAPALDAISKKPVRIVGKAGLPDEAYGYAVKKGNKELLDKLNAGLAKVMASPQWNELVKKYKLKDQH